MRVCCEALRLGYWPAKMRQGSAFAFAEGPWARHGTGGQGNNVTRAGGRATMILKYVSEWETCGCKDQMGLADAGKESSLTKRDESMTIGGAPRSRLCRGQLPIMHTLIVTAQVAADNAFWHASAEWIACGHVTGCRNPRRCILIYSNALPNGLSMSISCFMSSKTLYRPCHPSAAPGALERHQDTHAPLRPEQGAIEAIKRQLLCGAASRPSRRVLAGLAAHKLQNQKTPLPSSPSEA
jgi:hypothetical protein